MNVSVIIPSYNAASTLGVQLAALARQSVGVDSFEVVVADNGSHDDTKAVVAAHATELEVMLCDASARRGAAFARNEGARRSRLELLMFCDADDEVDERWIEAGLRAFSAGAQIFGGILDFKRLNSDDARDLRGGDRLGPMRHRGFLPFAHSSCLGVTRRLFVEIGGFDESIEYVGEDVDFSWRAQLAGHDLVTVEDAIVNYRLREDTSQTWKQMVGYGSADPVLFGRFRDDGMTRRTAGEVIRSIAWIVGYAPIALLRSGERARWVRATGQQAGRVIGSIRERTLYL